MRRTLAVVGAVLTLALVFACIVVVFTSPTTQTAPEVETDDRQLFSFDGYESGVWPYLSPAQSFRKRSPINVVVGGETDDVFRALRSSSEATWNVTEPDEGHVDPDDVVPEDVNISGTAVQWSDTVGTARYAYVHDGERGEWISETGQLHNGDYYGYRTHIRMYESPSPEEPWVAMQVHTEHFDWFTLRHAVDGVETGQGQVEAEFMVEPFVERVWRAHLANDGPSDADGWATVVELTTALPALLFGLVSVRKFWRRGLTPLDRERLRTAWNRITLQHVLLAVSIFGIVLGVRAGGIILEWTGWFTVHAIAALLYPFIAVGLPVVAYVFSHRLARRMDAAVTASGALGIAILWDYAYLGVDVLTVDVILQRTAVILALGLIAGGAAKRAARERRLNELLVTGIVLWVAILTATLLEWV